MRWWILTLCLITFLALLPTPTSAHLVGQPPFFQINGQYSQLYSVPTTSLENFDLPQDAPPENYYLNQPINFEFDQSRLPAPPEVIAKTTFTWYYGDGARATGLKNSHTYTKPGSYILTVYANDGSTPTPQLIQSVLLNILPDKNYQLPKAIIKTNGETHSDSLNNVTKIPFDRPINFDATASQAPSSQIVSYQWDFGDQTSSSKAVDTHSFSGNQFQTSIILRIKDQNGFFADNYLEIQDRNLDPASSNPPTPTSSQPAFNWWLASIPFGILVLIGLYFRFKKTHTRH